MLVWDTIKQPTASQLIFAHYQIHYTFYSFLLPSGLLLMRLMKSDLKCVSHHTVSAPKSSQPAWSICNISLLMHWRGWRMGRRKRHHFLPPQADLLSPVVHTPPALTLIYWPLEGEREKKLRGWFDQVPNFLLELLAYRTPYRRPTEIQRYFILSSLPSLFNSPHIWSFPSASHPTSCFKAWASQRRYLNLRPSSSLHRIRTNRVTQRDREGSQPGESAFGPLSTEAELGLIHAVSSQDTHLNYTHTSPLTIHTVPYFDTPVVWISKHDAHQKLFFY